MSKANRSYTSLEVNGKWGYRQVEGTDRYTKTGLRRIIEAVKQHFAAIAVIAFILAIVFGIVLLSIWLCKTNSRIDNMKESSAVSVAPSSSSSEATVLVASIEKELTYNVSEVKLLLSAPTNEEDYIIAGINEENVLFVEYCEEEEISSWLKSRSVVKYATWRNDLVKKVCIENNIQKGSKVRVFLEREILKIITINEKKSGPSNFKGSSSNGSSSQPPKGPDNSGNDNSSSYNYSSNTVSSKKPDDPSSSSPSSNRSWDDPSEEKNTGDREHNHTDSSTGENMGTRESEMGA